MSIQYHGHALDLRAAMSELDDAVRTIQAPSLSQEEGLALWMELGRLHRLEALWLERAKEAGP